MPTCKVCGKEASYGPSDSTKRTHCAKHGKEINGYRNNKHKHCLCGSMASYNYPNEKGAKYCQKCSNNRMVDVVHSKCIDCKKTIPTYGKPNEKPEYCLKCKDKLPNKNDYINVVDKRCFTNDCRKGASHNYPGEKPKYCASCAGRIDKKMISIHKTKCKGKNCKNLYLEPLYNLPNKPPHYCKDCKTNDMVDVRNKNKCIKCHGPRANFNYEGEKAQYCLKCSITNMVNVNKKKCECGKNIARYALTGEIVKYCDECKIENSVKYPRRKCELCKDEFATHGKSTAPHRCDNCALEDDYNLRERMCRSCGLLNLLNKDNICGYCDPTMIINMRFAKQKLVKGFLDKNNYTYDQYDTIIEKGICGKERPDFLFDCGTHFVVLEVDENQHDDRINHCEKIRMINISQSLGLPTRFLRYNPDIYVNINGETQNPSTEEREEMLKLWINNLVNDYNKNIYLDETYLFFDEIDTQPNEIIIDNI